MHQVFMYSRVRLGYVSVLSHSISEFDAQAAEDCNQHDYCVPAFRARAKTVHEKAKEKERELDDVSLPPHIQHPVACDPSWCANAD